MTVREIIEAMRTGDITSDEAQDKLANLLNPRLHPLTKEQKQRAERMSWVRRIK